jgi:hypothetical protein
MRDLSIFNTFTFSSAEAYNKFRTALSLKFDVELPAVTPTVNEAQSALARIRDNVTADSIGRDSEGNLVFRRGYYYKSGGSADQFANAIARQLTELGIDHRIIDNGEVWKSFRGGAKVKDQSHWWVKVRLLTGPRDQDSAADQTNSTIGETNAPAARKMSPKEIQLNQAADAAKAAGDMKAYHTNKMKQHEIAVDYDRRTGRYDSARTNLAAWKKHKDALRDLREDTTQSRDPYDQGYFNAMSLNKQNRNPFDPGTPEHREYHSGYEAGYAERREHYS